MDQELSDSAEVQIQTDFYEEEIVAVSVAGAGATGLRAEESCETVDVAKALDTLTKAFALKKESISQEGPTEKSKDELRSENSPGKEQTLDDETSDQRENIAEEAMEDSQAGGVEINSCTGLKDNPDSLSVHEELTVYTHEDHAFETQQTLLPSDSASQPTQLQSKSSPGLQEPCEIRRPTSVLSEEPIMYKNICFIMQNACLSFASSFFFNPKKSFVLIFPQL